MIYKHVVITMHLDISGWFCLDLQIVTDYRLQFQATNSSSPPGGPRGPAMHGLWIYIHIFVAVCAQAQELIAQSMVWRDCSHSLRPVEGHNGHRCSLAINTAQKEQIEITSTLLKEMEHLCL